MRTKHALTIPLLIVAVLCTAAEYVKSDDAKWADVASSGPNLQVIALEPTSPFDGEESKAPQLGGSFGGFKWMPSLCLVSRHLPFFPIPNLKQRQPVLRC